MARQVAADPRDFVTSCAMCRDQFAYAGKRSWHLLDLLFGAGDPVRAATRGPTWSERRSERSRFKKTLLRDLWSDSASRPTAGGPGLVISDALRLRLDRQGSMLWLQACQEAPGDRVAVMLDGFFWYALTLPRPTDTYSILINGPIGRAEAQTIVDSIPGHYRRLNPGSGLF
jgi:hypothetical protein